MSDKPLSVADYPLAERRPDIVETKTGKTLEDISLDAVLTDKVGLEDLRITDRALRQQAEVAKAAGRPTLAANFRRGAELVDVPQDVIMRTYELLRPGRAGSKDELLAAAKELRVVYGANGVAAFIEEAADVYERRSLYKKRY
ncbi:diol dehydratase small subunit [Hyphomicrobium sp. MC1]|uniref:diol dehydratase small subunit n=1 Tax=Hyphomicrobium sp. (strain MC1) TaxID=717785 RepID=UPI000213DD82|nr:diol dehydratase small subunit [Hyphomicrobium sp. MC1]CCB66997.1 Glycerol dehydratase small subunit [Hyphomicrobium sp. MC1]